MSKENDQAILELKEKIAEKKKTLSKVSKFSPITNCSIEIRGNRYNINVLNYEQLLILMIEINIYIISAKDLGIENLQISGFTVQDWMSDIRAKIDVLQVKNEEAALKQMENDLDILLSNEKKTELKISEIASLLNK